MLRYRGFLWVVLLASAGLLVACTEGETDGKGDTGGEAREVEPEEDGPAAPAPEGATEDPQPLDLPMDQDPAVVRAFEEAPTPPPAPFAASDLRRRAQGEGAFEGLPDATFENLMSLLGAFAKAQAEAKETPGEELGTPVGMCYFPSPGEIKAAELADRIARVVKTRPREKIQETLESAGYTGKAIEYKAFTEISIKCFGQGYVKSVEARSGKVVLVQ